MSAIMSIRTCVSLLIGSLLLAGCTTARSTAPQRTASEQLLISAAADRAAAPARSHDRGDRWR